MTNHSSIPAELLESLSESQAIRVAELLANNRLPCFSGKRDPQKADANGSRLGGPVMLPANMEVPCDRSGKPMILVAQFNFAELEEFTQPETPKRGLFLLFWNAARDSSNPKDRHAFRCIWIPDPNFANFVSTLDSSICTTSSGITFNPNWSVPQNPRTWQRKNNTDVDSELDSDLLLIRKILDTSNPFDVQLFGHAGLNFDILQETAAFSGNGISWSPTRRTDSCFSHLIEAAGSWQLFAKISSLPGCGLDLGKRALYLLIHADDLEKHNFDKCWLLQNE